MTGIVGADQIERIVGTKRHPSKHYGNAVSAEQTVYILHSQACVDSTPDLRECAYSKALDLGIDLSRWFEDEPYLLGIESGRLVPVAPSADPHLSEGSDRK